MYVYDLYMGLCILAQYLITLEEDIRSTRNGATGGYEHPDLGAGTELPGHSLNLPAIPSALHNLMFGFISLFSLTSLILAFDIWWTSQIKYSQTLP